MNIGEKKAVLQGRSWPTISEAKQKLESARSTKPLPAEAYHRLAQAMVTLLYGPELWTFLNEDQSCTLEEYSNVLSARDEVIRYLNGVY